MNIKKYWLYAPGENAYKWDEFYELGIMALGWDELEDIRQYGSKEEIKKTLIDLYGGDTSMKNSALANYDFLNTVSIGDIIIVKKGVRELLGYGEVTSDYIYDENRSDYYSVRRVDWKLKGNWKINFNLAQKTLTDITSYPSSNEKYDTYYEQLLGIMSTEQSISKKNEVRKHPLNIILYGPPGTGKTYNSIDKAVEIATGSSSDHISNKKLFDKLRKQEQIEFVTFHQNYSYEDFMVGIRPSVSETTNELSFKKYYGIFYKIAKRARENYENSLKDKQTISKENWVKKKFDEFINSIRNTLENGNDYQIGTKFPERKVLSIVDDIYYQQGGEKGVPRHMDFNDIIYAYLDNTFENRDIQNNSRLTNTARNPGLTQYYVDILKQFKDFAGVYNEQIDRETENNTKRKNFVLIIDEINRANISKVFGELITLLEDDKRLDAANELKITLPDGEKDFCVPPNLYIIGTMNTADKSIALIDIALRRRFELIAFYPNYNLLNPEASELLQKINEKIYELKKSADFLIGHAYFMKDEPIETTLKKQSYSSFNGVFFWQNRYCFNRFR